MNDKYNLKSISFNSIIRVLLLFPFSKILDSIHNYNDDNEKKNIFFSSYIPSIISVLIIFKGLSKVNVKNNKI